MTHTAAQIASAYPPVPKGKQKPVRGPSSPATQASGEPPLFRVLRDLGVILNPAPKDGNPGLLHEISCPWYQDHSDGVQAPTGSCVTFHTDNVARAFKCHHTSCVDRTLADVLTLAKDRGLTIPAGSVNARPARPDLPVVLITADESDVVEQIEEILATRHEIYLRGDAIVHVDLNAPGGVAIRQATQAWIGRTTAESVRLEKLAKVNGNTVRVRSGVPTYAPGYLLAKPGPAYRKIEALAPRPRFTAGGTIHSTPGELKDGVLYTGPAVDLYLPEQLTQADARAAYKRFNKPFDEVPFASDEHRAAYCAALLTVVARPAIPGPVPAVVTDANVGGSGKGLGANCGHVITCGSHMTVSTCPRDEAEFKKAALPWVMGGAAIQVLDEITFTLGHGAMNAFITSTHYSDRVLGSSTTASAPNQVVLWFLGNNISIAGETMRRCLYYRLEPMVEHPEDREFKIPDLLAHVEEHQAGLLRDLMIMLKAFHAAGRPASDLKVWGGFAAWSSLVRDCIYWATGLDIDCRQSLAATGDPDRTAHSDLLVEFSQSFGTNGATVSDIICRAVTNPTLRNALEAVCPTKDGRFSPGAVGKKLASFKKRLANGLYFDVSPAATRSGVLMWCVKTENAIPLNTRATAASAASMKKPKYA